MSTFWHAPNKHRSRYSLKNETWIGIGTAHRHVWQVTNLLQNIRTIEFHRQALSIRIYDPNEVWWTSRQLHDEFAEFVDKVRGSPGACGITSARWSRLYLHESRQILKLVHKDLSSSPTQVIKSVKKKFEVHRLLHDEFTEFVDKAPWWVRRLSTKFEVRCPRAHGRTSSAGGSCLYLHESRQILKLARIVSSLVSYIKPLNLKDKYEALRHDEFAEFIDKVRGSPTGVVLPALVGAGFICTKVDNYSGYFVMSHTSYRACMQSTRIWKHGHSPWS